MSETAQIVLLVFLVTAPFIAIALCFIFHKEISNFNKKFVIKPHVYRQVDGRYIVRAYKLLGRNYLRENWDSYEFGAGHENSRTFRTLEDATQAFERWNDEKERVKERMLELKRAHKEAVAKSGVVHRF